MRRIEEAVIDMLEAIKLKSQLDEKIEKLKSIMTIDMLDCKDIPCNPDDLVSAGVLYKKCRYVQYSLHYKGVISISLHGDMKSKTVSSVTKEFVSEVYRKVK